MFYKIPPISTSYERNEKSLPKPKIQEIKANDNEEEFSDVLIDTMVNSTEYSAIDLANTIMNHCSSEILLESLKRNIAKNKAKNKDLDDPKQYASLIRYLQYRGYEFDDIKEALEIIKKEKYND